MTAQEKDLLLNEVTEIVGNASGTTLVAQYNEEPNGDFAAHRPAAPPDSQQTLLPLDS